MAAYKCRLRGIVKLAPTWVSEELLSASQHIGDGRAGLWTRFVKSELRRQAHGQDGAKNVCSARWHDILLIDVPATLAIPDIRY